jgi:uncharacterized SAM-binding protein YcdF (DUF218 family)
LPFEAEWSLNASLKSLLPWIEPIGLSLIVLTALLIHFLRRRHWKMSAGVALSWALLLLTTCTPLPNVLLGTLEKPWSSTDLKSLPKADAIVVLGGAAAPSLTELVGVHFTIGADRLMTAVDLIRSGKSDTLVCGGGGRRQQGKIASEADAVKAWLDSWEVLKTPVISLGTCADTHEEAVKTAELMEQKKWETLILVTSASHMRRAEAAFKKAGCQVVCAPCNWLSSPLKETPFFGFHGPRAGGADLFHAWFHEIIGTWVYRIRGWI